MKNGARLLLSDRAKQDRSGIGPSNRNDSSRENYAGYRRSLRQHPHQRFGGVMPNPGKRAEAGHEHANGAVHQRHRGPRMRDTASSAATEGGTRPFRTWLSSSNILAAAVAFE